MRGDGQASKRKRDNTENRKGLGATTGVRIIIIISAGRELISESLPCYAD